MIEDIIDTLCTEQETFYYVNGYRGKSLDESQTPITLLEYLYYELGKLDRITDFFEMGDNYLLYTTDIYAEKRKQLTQLIVYLKKGDE